MEVEDFLISEFMRLGCKSKKEAAILMQVYLELSEVRKYYDVKYFFDSCTEKMYLTARRRKSAIPTVFLPVPSVNHLSLLEIQNFINSSAKETKSVCLVIINPDSTSVFYELTEGLIAPQEIEEARGSESTVIDNILQKNLSTLKGAALLGLPVNLSGKTDTERNSKQ